MRTLVLVALLSWLPLVAVAQEEESASLAEMVEQQVAFREELARGPQDLTPRQAGIMRRAQAEFFRLVEGKSSMDQLSLDEKVQLENALERINAQVVGTGDAQGNQDVCWREQRLGSRTKNTRCGTQKEIDQVRENAQGYLSKPQICTPPGCG